MVYACDDCAYDKGYIVGTVIPDGPVHCEVCGKKTANAIWSEGRVTWGDIAVVTFFALCLVIGTLCYFW